jgi:hypothetical protein
MWTARMWLTMKYKNGNKDVIGRAAKGQEK